MSHIMSEQNPSSERNHHLSAAPSAPAPTMATGHRRGRGSGGTNIKALSRAHTSAQWKESLRKSCLERAKHARMERLRKSRLINVSFDNSAASSNAASLNLLPPEEGCNINNNRLKRGRDDEVEDIDWCGINNYNQVEVINNGRANVTEDCNLGVDSPLISSPIDGQTRTSFSQLQEDSNMREGDDDEMKEENIVDTAKALVEQELQRALSGVQHCRALLTRSTRARDDDIDYSISHEEFLELLNDVTEEMQRDGT